MFLQATPLRFGPSVWVSRLSPVQAAPRSYFLSSAKKKHRFLLQVLFFFPGALAGSHALSPSLSRSLTRTRFSERCSLSMTLSGLGLVVANHQRFRTSLYARMYARPFFNRLLCAYKHYIYATLVCCPAVLCCDFFVVSQHTEIILCSEGRESGVRVVALGEVWCEGDLKDAFNARLICCPESHAKRCCLCPQYKTLVFLRAAPNVHFV